MLHQQKTHSGYKRKQITRSITASHKNGDNWPFKFREEVKNVKMLGLDDGRRLLVFAIGHQSDIYSFKLYYK